MIFVHDFAYKNYIVVVMILSDLLFLIWCKQHGNRRHSSFTV